MTRAPRKKLFLALFFLILVGGGLAYWKIAHGVGNRTWDGGGTDGTCGGVGTANNWSCAANWSLDLVPSNLQGAIFDATSTKDVIIDTNINIVSISINAGYSGTITQSGSFTVSIGASGYSQAAGSFAGGSGAITVNGVFTLSGGTFTNTTGTFTIGSGLTSSTTLFTVSSGTFNHNNGTVSFVPDHPGCADATYTVDVVTSLTLYNIIFNTPGGCGVHSILTTASGDTIIAANDCTLAGEIILNGTWEVQGNVAIGSTTSGGTGTLTMTGTGSKTYTYTAGGVGPYLRINNAGLTVSANTGTTDLAVQYFSLLAGTFIAPTGTFSIGSGLTSSTTPLTVSGGTFNHNNGTVSIYPGNNPCVNQTYTLDVATSLTLYNVILNSNATCSQNNIFTTASGDTIIVANNFTFTGGILNGTWEVQGNYTVATTADGGSAGITFTGGNMQIYTDQGGNESDGNVTINKTVNGVTLASNADWNAASQTLTITSGTLLQSSTYAVATGAVTIGASGKWVNNGTGAVTLGGALANSGLVDFRTANSCGSTDSIALHSSVNGTQRAWSGAGTFVMRDIEVKDQGGSATITAYSSTSTSGNGGNWTFNATCPFPILPKAGLSGGKMNMQSGKINLR